MLSSRSILLHAGPLFGAVLAAEAHSEFREVRAFSRRAGVSCSLEKDSVAS